MFKTYNIIACFMSNSVTLSSGLRCNNSNGSLIMDTWWSCWSPARRKEKREECRKGGREEGRKEGMVGL